MLTYPLNKIGNQPKYVYLYQCIRNDIAAGRIADGERLPSKRALAQHLGVGVVTVANAYDLLVQEGYAVSEERKGFFARYDGSAPRRKPAAQADKLKRAESEQADEPLADLRANRSSMRLFPAATWNKLMRSTISQGGDLLGTVPYNGLAVLREAIAEYLRTSRGMHVDPVQIVIGAGTEYLYGRLAQLFGHTRIFGFEDPGYKRLSTICHYMGCESRFIPIDEQGMRIDSLEESDADIIHVSPANQFPTGNRMGPARRTDLLEWAYRSSRRYIVEDDYDSEFRYRGGYQPPLFDQDDRNRVIYLNTFSKTLVPSLRISYMVLPPALLERYRDSLSFYSCTVSSFEQYTLAQFIAQGYFERHINRIKTYYRKHRAHVLSALKSSPLAKISRVIEHNAGTHFLLVVDTALSPEQIRARAEAAHLGLSFYADYAETATDAVPPTSLVVNYAAIEPEKIEPVVAKLVEIFPECESERAVAGD